MTARPDPDYLAVCARWKDLATLASTIEPVKLPMHCEGHDFRATVKDLERLVSAVDRVIAAYGDYINSNSSGSIELALFQDQLAGALEGNCFYEVETVAEQADEEIAELEAAE